jgi:hypothetical protein
MKISEIKHLFMAVLYSYPALLQLIHPLKLLFSCLYHPLPHYHHQTEKRPREEMLREILNLGEGGLLFIKQTASTIDSVQRSVAVQNILCWLACFVHNGPPSPKFQILPSQLRQTADRAAGLCIKSLRSPLWWGERGIPLAPTALSLFLSESFCL